MQRINWIISQNTVQVPNLQQIGNLMQMAIGIISCHQLGLLCPKNDVIHEQTATTSVSGIDLQQVSVQPDIYQTDKKTLLYSQQVQPYGYWLEINFCEGSASLDADRAESPTGEYYEVTIGELLEGVSWTNPN